MAAGAARKPTMSRPEGWSLAKREAFYGILLQCRPSLDF